MKNSSSLRILLFGLLFAAFFASPQAVLASGGGDEDKPFNPAKDLILPHVLDEYEWHLATLEDDHHVSIPLPIILIVDGNLEFFMSSAFHHPGEDGFVQGKHGSYKLDHEAHKIVEKSGKKIIDFSLTKNASTILIATIILLLIFIPVANATKRNEGSAPKGMQNFFEPIFEFIRDDIVIPNIGQKHYKKYLPFIMTIFFFIWIVNLLGLLPTGANASGNIAFTLTLAVITLIVTLFSGNKHYWEHILWTPGVPLPLRIIMLPVEVLGIFTKPLALMIRLFANITAGHMIILSLISFIFIFKNAFIGLAVGPVIVAMTFLELFVAALQAYIFALLTALFIGMAVQESHDH